MAYGDGNGICDNHCKDADCVGTCRDLDKAKRNFEDELQRAIEESGARTKAPFQPESLSINNTVYIPEGLNTPRFILADAVRDYTTLAYEADNVTGLLGNKYEEAEMLSQLIDYINSTYSQHYATGDKDIQTHELIGKIAERGLTNCLCNIIKYADRAEYKGQTRKDLLKILHYGLMALYYFERVEANNTDANEDA